MELGSTSGWDSDGPAAVSANFPASVDTPRAARLALQPLRCGLSAKSFDVLSLLVSEVVTNAVRHGAAEGESITLGVFGMPARLRVEVGDPGPGFAIDSVPASGSIDPTAGWSLGLVDELATAWGVERGGSTRVWFELPVAVRAAATEVPQSS